VGPVKQSRTLPTFLQRTDLRLLLFGGKGGVGKTTCAAAAALYLAGNFPDRTFLVVSIDPAHSLKDSFAGPSPLPNLEMLEIDSRERLRKFKEEHAEQFRQIALRGTFLDDDDVTQLLDLSIPGLDEIMAFDEISCFVQEDAYSCIVVDTAPTGHMLRFLELPQVLREWIDALDAMLAKHRYLAKLYRGFYRKDQIDVFLEDLAGSVERVASLLRDPLRCSFVPVMIAEPFCIAETQRLFDKLQTMKIPVTDILVNLLYRAAANCPQCSDARGRQRRELRRFSQQSSGHTLWEIPIQGAEVRGSKQLAGFWDSVCPVGESGEETSAAASVPVRVDGPTELPSPEVSLLFFAGKGGVGKTTLASATAFRLARHYTDKQVFLFSSDPAHSLSDCLDTSVGARETRLGPRLTAMEVDAEAEFQGLRKQYADEVAEFFDALTSHGTIDLAFDREVIERMMDLSPPGLDEVMALTRVVDFLEAGKYDIFVIDTAPTGHLVRLLELPELIQDWLKVFFDLLLKYRNVFRLPKISELLVGIAKGLKVLRSLLADPQKAELYAVSILTEMAFEETRDLFAFCRRAGIHVPALFLNLATPPGDCSVCRGLAEAESKLRRRFQKAFRDAQQTVVYRCGEPRGAERLTELSQAIYRDSHETGPARPVRRSASKTQV